MKGKKNKIEMMFSFLKEVNIFIFFLAYILSYVVLKSKYSKDKFILMVLVKV
jgi:hypothetical protein